MEASVGHIRDLPRGAADVPAKYKGESWARLGVDVDNSFAPLYIITPEKKGKVAELKDALKSVDEVLLATDPDREGEAIAWHLLDTLKPKVPVRRMVFHEISEPAIRAAVENLRDLDHDLVDAQETRRILDRLYGYEVSPVLWKKVMPKLSAGRVQSVATRIIVQRERERMAFVSASLLGHRRRARRRRRRHAEAVPGAARGRRRGPRRHAAATSVRMVSSRARRPARSTRRRRARLAEALEGRDLAVESVESKPYTRKPYAPFMTSTLQQEAGRKLRFSADRTMRGAQRLYENGYITYLRTDSTTLSAVGHRRRADAGARAVRRRLRARPAAAVHAQGQERAGGPRGHPARRGAVPHPRRGGARARRRRLPALRAHLAAHGRLADGRRPRHHRQRADRGHGGHRRGRHVRGVRSHDHVPRLPQGLRRDPRRRQRRARPTTPSPACPS